MFYAVELEISRLTMFLCVRWVHALFSGLRLRIVDHCDTRLRVACCRALLARTGVLALFTLKEIAHYPSKRVSSILAWLPQTH